MFSKLKKINTNKQKKTRKPKRKMLAISRIDRDLLPLLKAGAKARNLKEWAYYNELLWMAICIEMTDLPELRQMVPVDLDLDANPNFVPAQHRLRWLIEPIKLVKIAVDKVRFGSNYNTLGKGQDIQ